MKVIYKYKIPISSEEGVFIPAGSRFLSLQCQDDQPVVYWITDPAEKRMCKWYFKTIGTGWEFNEEELEGWTFIGTVQQLGGQLMWHIWTRMV